MERGSVLVCCDEGEHTEAAPPPLFVAEHGGQSFTT